MTKYEYFMKQNKKLLKDLLATKDYYIKVEKKEIPVCIESAIKWLYDGINKNNYNLIIGARKILEVESDKFRGSYYKGFTNLLAKYHIMESWEHYLKRRKYINRCY